MRDKIDVVIVAYGAGEFLARMAVDLPEMTSRPRELHIGYNKGLQRNLAMSKNDLAVRGDGTYILFANGDVLISPGWDDRLVGFLEAHPEVGAALPLPVGDPERPHLWKPDLPEGMTLMGIPSAAQMTALAEALADKKGHYVYGVSDEDLFCPFFSVLVRRSTFLTMKGFDERLRFYGSDRDFTRRLIRRGWAVAGVRSCPFWHAKSASVPEASRNEEFDDKVEWKHRNEVAEAIERKELVLWDELSASDRAAVRNDPKYTHLGRPSCSRA